MRLAGKTAVVTGASRGIGQAIAALFQREGAGVAGCARRAAPGVDACDVGQAAQVLASVNDDLQHVSSDLLIRILASLGYRVKVSVVRSDTAA